MKIKIMALLALMLLTGCVSEKQVYTQSPNSQINQLSDIPENMRFIPKTQLPKEIKNGAFSGKASNGRTFKTIVKNGYMDKYFDVYHPNGKLHSHTPLVNGIAEGWSEGYTEDGKLRTKIRYKKGHLIQAQLYDEKGNLIKDIKN